MASDRINWDYFEENKKQNGTNKYKSKNNYFDLCFGFFDEVLISIF